MPVPKVKAVKAPGTILHTAGVLLPLADAPNVEKQDIGEKKRAFSGRMQNSVRKHKTGITGKTALLTAQESRFMMALLNGEADALAFNDQYSNTGVVPRLAQQLDTHMRNGAYFPSGRYHLFQPGAAEQLLNTQSYNGAILSISNDPNGGQNGNFAKVKKNSGNGVGWGIIVFPDATYPDLPYSGGEFDNQFKVYSLAFSFLGEPGVAYSVSFRDRVKNDFGLIATIYGTGYVQDFVFNNIIPGDKSYVRLGIQIVAPPSANDPFFVNQMAFENQADIMPAAYRQFTGKSNPVLQYNGTLINYAEGTLVFNARVPDNILAEPVGSWRMLLSAFKGITDGSREEGKFNIAFNRASADDPTIRLYFRLGLNSSFNIPVTAAMRGDMTLMFSWSIAEQRAVIIWYNKSTGATGGQEFVWGASPDYYGSGYFSIVNIGSWDTGTFKAEMEMRSVAYINAYMPLSLYQRGSVNPMLSDGIFAEPLPRLLTTTSLLYPGGIYTSSARIEGGTSSTPPLYEVGFELQEE